MNNSDGNLRCTKREPTDSSKVTLNGLRRIVLRFQTDRYFSWAVSSMYFYEHADIISEGVVGREGEREGEVDLSVALPLLLHSLGSS